VLDDEEIYSVEAFYGAKKSFKKNKKNTADFFTT